MTAKRSKREPHSRRDDNRHIRQTVIAEIDRLMGEQLDKDFTGNVEVLVPAKGGILGEPQFVVKRFGKAPGSGAD